MTFLTADVLFCFACSNNPSPRLEFPFPSPTAVVTDSIDSEALNAAVLAAAGKANVENTEDTTAVKTTVNISNIGTTGVDNASSNSNTDARVSTKTRGKATTKPGKAALKSVRMNSTRELIEPEGKFTGTGTGTGSVTARTQRDIQRLNDPNLNATQRLNIRKRIEQDRERERDREIFSGKFSNSKDRPVQLLFGVKGGKAALRTKVGAAALEMERKEPNPITSQTSDDISPPTEVPEDLHIHGSPGVESAGTGGLMSDDDISVHSGEGSIGGTLNIPLGMSSPLAEPNMAIFDATDLIKSSKTKLEQYNGGARTHSAATAGNSDTTTASNGNGSTAGAVDETHAHDEGQQEGTLFSA